MSIKVNPFVSTAPLQAKPKEAAAEAPSNAPAVAKDAFVSTGTPASHTVKAGDTLTKIALRYKLTLGELLTLNPQLAEGAKRRMDGSRIYVGDVVKLKADKPATPPTPTPAPTPDPRVGELENELKDQKAQAVIQRAKFSISRMAGPESWASHEEAGKAIASAEANLAKVPSDDPDHASLKGQVDAAVAAYAQFKSENARLAAEPDKVGDTKDQIQALSKAAVALATPDEKAHMIRNLVRRDNADKHAEKKILELLLDANRQGQLGAVMDTLHGMNRRVLGLKDNAFMDYLLPRVMSDRNLNALEQIGTVGKHDGLVKAAQEERQERLERQQLR